MDQPVEIISSKVSVYEIELDLSEWEKKDSGELPFFHDALHQTIASLQEHKCLKGETGGFLSEVREGTNFAHVIEHVILELIHLSDPSKDRYTGWTRKTLKDKYIIHYGAPDFLTGRVAAVLGVNIVKRLINGEKPDLSRYINLVKHPIKYFTHEDIMPENLPEYSEPSSLIEELDSPVKEFRADEIRLSLSANQKNSISNVLKEIGKHMNYIVELWRRTFFDYSGEFGKTIIDKIELINLDKFMDLLTAGDFDNFFRAIKKVTHVISSYRIPINFVVHSIWLYKNHLINYIIEEYADDHEKLYKIVSDFELLYKIILQNLSDGSRLESPVEVSKRIYELKTFREMKAFRELRQRQHNRILVLNTDEITFMVLRDLLVNYGYVVIRAENKAGALHMLDENGEDISLILLDLDSPEMRDPNFYARLESHGNGLGYILSSNFPIDSEISNCFSGKRVMFVQKPYKLDKFVKQLKSKFF